jgi:two-component system LytT family response regulator
VQYVDIIAVEADANYLKLHTTETQFRMRGTLSHFIQQASHFPIQQINRSVAVNLEHIKEIQRYFKGEYAIIMKTGLQFTTSSRFRNSIQELLD